MLYNMASLFGKNKLREIAQKLDTATLEDKISIVRTWHNDYHNGSLKADKETSREQAYNQDFFMRILGYREKPAVPYTLEPKATTDKGQLPDAVLSHTDVTNAIKHIAAVVELKGASIELDRPQRREGNMSPVQQGFKYKTQYRNCPFVIISNFWEFRLYHDNQLDYELWTLDDLVDPNDDYLKFKTFYTLLHSDNLTTLKGTSKTEGWLSDVRFEQEEISKKFYKVYREARLDLLRDLYQHNDVVRKNIDLGIEKAQKIIDRIVFACFAEDRGLLPDDTLRRVVQSADNSAYGSSLWSTFKGFFEAIDVGNDKLEIPNGYNGGLFATDEILDSLKISDESLRKVASLSNYNFVEDLSVSILGHIFEQSISDLEEIKNKVEDSQDIESLQHSRRKKDGIFYTPDYIVRYIVDNSLGTYLREEEERLKIAFKLKGDISDKNYEKREHQAYGHYQDFLQNVKVVDPACGSGAFLVYVFDYLMAENRRIASILGNNLFSSEDYIKSILNNNIYGVDLNDESVEITKLSLWLKSAQKGKKLTTLDNNIKAGNSLVDDRSVVGNKAFNWQSEFTDVFKHGGFDVVVGNPPYVSAMDIKKYLTKEEYDFLKKKYITATGSVDLYIYFFERGLLNLKEGGKLAYISPNRFLSASYGKGLRTWLIDNFTVNRFVDYSDKKVFSDASTYPVLSFITKKKSSNYTLAAGNINDGSVELKEFNSAKLTILDDNILGFLLNDKIKITEKVFNQSFALTNVGKINATSTAKEAEEFTPLVNETNDGVKLVNTGTIDPYLPLWGHSLLTNKGSRFIEPYLNLESNIISEKRKNLYLSPKIIIAKIGLSCEAFYDTNGSFASINTNCIHSFNDDFSAEYVLCWLNSKLFNYTFECLFDGLRMSGGYLLYSAPNLRNTRIKKIHINEQKPYAEFARTLAESYSELQILNNNFKNLIRAEFNVDKWPTKLNKWWTKNFVEFIAGIDRNLSITQKDELLQIYEKYKKTCLELDSKITATQKEIDYSLYKLHGLTLEEVAIVEGK